MGIFDEFNPTRDGWSFVNWGEANDFTWDLYRRTHLAINPTNDPIVQPTSWATRCATIRVASRRG